ncbi:PTS cellobiose transporter subunit IIBC, partial [Staphylococcus sp. HMSC062E10]
PQQREMRKAFRLAKQVEVGSQQIGFRKESHRTKQVGVAEAVP